MARVLTLGELLIDFVPTLAGRDVGATETWQRAAGGAPANVAVGLARLGVPVTFLGKVGDDPFGHYLAEVLQREHVDTRGLCFTAAARTALAFVALAADGERDFMFYRHPSADMLHAPEDIDPAWFHDASILHVGSISMISEPSRSATLRAIELAQQQQVLLSCDPNLRLALWPSADAARQAMRELISYAQIVKVSLEELTFLTLTDDPEQAAQQLWHSHLQLLVVTQGAAGCAYRTKAGWKRVASPQVQAIDATGAGDAFVAAMLAHLYAEHKLPEQPDQLAQALRFACVAGALTTTQYGAIPALPTREAIDHTLDGSDVA